MQVPRHGPDSVPGRLFPHSSRPRARVSPEEAVGVVDAIRLYTWNGAYLGKEEGFKGSIEQGKLADMVVLDRDILTVPLEEIKDIRVLMTIVDGKVVYRR